MGRRVPWTGSIFPNASKVMLLPDDAHGIRNLYRFPQDYPNVFASGQYLENRNGQNVIQNISSDPATGMLLPRRVELCPDEKLNTFVTIGTHSQWARKTDYRIYALPWIGPFTQDACSSLDGVGTELKRSSAIPNGYRTFSFPVSLSIPTAIPRGVPLAVYTGLDPGNKLASKEKRGYDNCARHAVELLVKPVATCGK